MTLATAGAAAPMLTACNAPARLATLPESFRGRASFHGMPAESRVVLDGSQDDVLGHIAASALRREVAYAQSQGRKDLDPADFLAISGGGENGAYGAGMLTAWSERGDRPMFKAVTGVSTGALIAPFAYLGPAYDKQLERFYTAIGPADIMVSRGLISGLLGESMYDSTPLLKTIRGVMTPEMVQAIAAEHRKGRLLCIATTNLDVPVGVLWNIGEIAGSGNKDAGELISRILLASASIPGAFPPVMIDLDAGGEHFEEMHVDGGTVAQVVFYPPSFSSDEYFKKNDRDALALRRLIAKRKRSIYVIRNSRPGADMQTVDRSTMKIAGRAVSTLIATQGIGDLYQLYVIARRDGIDYHVSWIPPSFTEKLKEPFDPGYMNRLYQVGRKAVLDGTAWSKYPPGFSPTPLTPAGSPAAAG
ncbi:MAG: patatin-like phospholipase family protein [Proteobacteria bacterium]|nr:patatin-like phospholipase family protein [Pseudomonadota bacterium]